MRKGLVRGATVLFLAGFFLFVMGLLNDSQAQADARIWKVGTLAPKGVGYAKQVENILLPVIRKATDDQLRLKVYWGGVMGDERQNVQKMRIGQLQGAGMSAQGAFIACPEMTVLGLPFLFENYTEVDYIRDRMFPTFEKLMADRGFFLWIWADQDFDQIYSINAPIDRLQDFKKPRFATWFGALEGKVLESLGATPMPMEVSEMPTSVRSGVCDAMICPAIWVVGTQLYGTMRYFQDEQIRYSPAVIMVTNSAWESLSESHRDKVTGVRQDVTQRFCEGSRQDVIRCMEAMEKYGLKKTAWSAEQRDLIKTRSLSVYQDLADDLFPAELLAKIQTQLSEFRSIHK